MKKVAKIVVLGFAGILLAFGLLACEPSKEEIEAQAIELDATDLNRQIDENAAKAKQEWDGKIVRYTATCGDVTTGTAELYQSSYKGYPVDAEYVSLSEDELASLEKGKTYTVIGTIKMYEFSFDIVDAFLVSE